MTIVFDFQANTPEDKLSACQLLLECYRKALGHDLPNRLVAAQALTNLILEDPAQPLEAESQSLLERVSRSVRLAGELIRALADLGDLCRDPGSDVQVDLTETVREALAEVRRLYPDRAIDSHLPTQLPTISGPLLPILRSLSLLFQWMCTRTPVPGTCLVEVTPVLKPNGAGIQIVMPGVVCSAQELQTVFEPFPVVQETNNFGQGLGLVPVCLFLSVWGGRLTADSSALGVQFTLEAACS